LIEESKSIKSEEYSDELLKRCPITTKLTKEQIRKHEMHIGKAKSSWNPKMKKFIKGWIHYVSEGNTYSTKVYVIRSSQVLLGLIKMEQIIRDVIEQNKTILFVGTKASASNLLGDFCEKYMDKDKYPEISSSINYVNKRWIGGTITNAKNIVQQIKKFRKLMIALNDKELLSSIKDKKEQRKLVKDYRKKNKLYGGLINLIRGPDYLFVIDAKHEAIAIKEAIQKGIYVIGTTNIDANPQIVDTQIPMNDEGQNSLLFLFKILDDIFQDAIITLRAFNENLTKKEYLERLEQNSPKVEEKETSSEEIKDLSDITTTHLTSTNIKNKLIDEEEK